MTPVPAEPTTAASSETSDAPDQTVPVQSEVAPTQGEPTSSETIEGSSDAPADTAALALA